MKRIFSMLLCALLFVSALCVPCANAVEPEQADGVQIINLGIPLINTFSDKNASHLYARSVWGMQVYDGKIYVGGGDYDKNSGTYAGGIPIRYYDPKTGLWKPEGRAMDEQLTRFFLVNDRLYIAGTDPMTGTNGQYYYRNDEGVWKTNTNVKNALHMFDMLFLDQGKTVFAGLGTNYGESATVALSEDGGETFRNLYFRKDGVEIKGSVFTNNGQYTAQNYARTYNLFEYKGEVYGTFWCSVGDIRSKYQGLYRYNAEEDVFDYYCDVPYSLTVTSMSQSYDLTYKNQFVYAYNALMVFEDDLKSYRQVNGFSGLVTCAQEIEGTLYFTTYQQQQDGTYISRMYKTDDLEKCELITEFTYTSYVRSFCYYDGVFYLGTEGNRYAASTTTGTVFSMVIKTECTHPNTVKEFTPAKGASKGSYREYCPDCHWQMFDETFTFEDIENRWYIRPVLQACKRGLMKGNSDTEFSPNNPTTRAQLVSVLYRMENSPSIDGYSNPFDDVSAGKYYTEAVIWAAANDIVNGTNATTFSPGSNITREQFAAILYRYARYKKIDVSANANLSVYSDRSAISKYAEEPLGWANAKGYITGVSDTSINPRGTASRAQMATILIRYLEDIGQ